MLIRELADPAAGIITTTKPTLYQAEEKYVRAAKRAPPSPPRLGVDAEHATSRTARPCDWPAAVQLSVPRTTFGTNEYSSLHPAAVRCAFTLQQPAPLTLNLSRAAHTTSPLST